MAPEQWSHRLVAQDAGLSRRKHGFETRWDHQYFLDSDKEFRARISHGTQVMPSGDSFPKFQQDIAKPLRIGKSISTPDGFRDDVTQTILQGMTASSSKPYTEHKR